MRAETTAVFRSVDQHSGIVLTVGEIDRLKADNYRLASRIEELEAELADALTALDGARRTR